ncbi:hypothetical protein PENSPDRAFT_483834 [Peniophora sp. CONT]|nr:hypothetical protein PENSPDRAFT_483834 [Peniophora sp. CONT]
MSTNFFAVTTQYRGRTIFVYWPSQASTSYWHYPWGSWSLVSPCACLIGDRFPFTPAGKPHILNGRNNQSHLRKKYQGGRTTYSVPTGPYGRHLYKHSSSSVSSVSQQTLAHRTGASSAPSADGSAGSRLHAQAAQSQVLSSLASVLWGRYHSVLE